MRGWIPFEVEFNFEVRGKHCLRVTGNYYPGCSARTNCLPENATPAEETELDDVHVWVQHCKAGKLIKERAVPDGAVDILMDGETFENDVLAAIMDNQDEPDYDRED